jgi:hypothetical protein
LPIRYRGEAQPFPVRPRVEPVRPTNERGSRCHDSFTLRSRSPRSSPPACCRHRGTGCDQPMRRVRNLTSTATLVATTAVVTTLAASTIRAVLARQLRCKCGRSGSRRDRVFPGRRRRRVGVEGWT